MQTLLHIETLGELYLQVQQSGMFSDSKYFVDSVPKQPVDIVLNAFEKERSIAGFNLKTFVEANFHLPQAKEKENIANHQNIVDHINNLWAELTRQPDEQAGTLIALPHNYIVPGGRFREIYYWDSFFTMLGLKESGRFDLIDAMLDNFAHLILNFGFIPNGNRSYYLSRSQPPFFALMVNLLAHQKGTQVFKTYLPALQKEYTWWMDENNESHVITFPDGTKLNRYFDALATPRPEAFIEDEHTAKACAATYRHLRSAAESGWDFSSRWLQDHHDLSTIQTTNIIPVDLNCLLYFMEQTLAKALDISGDNEAANTYNLKAGQRKAGIQKYLWQQNTQSFYDYNFVDETSIVHENLSMIFPLFFNIATAEQAVAVAKKIEEKFLKAGGVVTTLYNTGQQWDAPNGWATLQYLTVVALQNYGHAQLANTIKKRWMHLCENVFMHTGKMMEKYNVEDLSLLAGGGEYPNQDGFGWTNGVYLNFAANP